LNREGIIELLGALGSHALQHEGEWVQASCPGAFARHAHGHDSNPSFGINVVDDGKSGFNCFACGLKGRDLNDLLIELHHEAKQHDHKGIDFAKARQIVAQEDDIGYVAHEWKDTSDVKVFEPWPEWYLDDYKPAWGHLPARDYLMARNVYRKTAKELDIRYDAKRDMVCFPIRHRSGFLAGLRGRSLTTKRYFDHVWNGNNNTSVVLYGESWIDPLKPLVVVEGPFDLAVVYPHYKNVCAIFMASINKRKMATIELAASVLAMTDSDMAGEQVFWHLRDVMPDTQRVQIPEGKKDPGEMTAVEIRAALEPFVKVVDYVE
jgi:5S rRNA maturation endonuclease (ribonuclease M5)